MELDRRQRHLQEILHRKSGSETTLLMPLVNRWHEVLNSISGLSRRRPGAHSRVFRLAEGVLTIEVDHPAWMQLLQWHEEIIVSRLGTVVPALSIRALQFRLTAGGEPIERPTVIMPEPVKSEMTPQEQEKFDSLLVELESLIQKNSKGVK